jgi:hypothetical protein
MEQHFHSMMPWLITTIIILALWDFVWKFIALWKAARNNHLAWFICIAVFNTVGILPIIYLLLQRKDDNTDTVNLNGQKDSINLENNLS